MYTHLLHNALLYCLYMNKKVIGFSVGLSMVFVSVLGVSAQSASDATAPEPTLYALPAEAIRDIMPISASVGDVDTIQTSTCLDLQSASLRYKATDSMTNGEVSMLQDFLVATSLLKTQVTGYFGLATFSAVKQFQKKSGFSPTGYVGPLTKAKIKEMSCNGEVVPLSQNQGQQWQGQPQQGGQNGIQPKPAVLPTTNGSGTPTMMGRPPMNASASPLPPVYGSTTPGFPPSQWMGMSSGTPKMPPTAVACTMEARLCPDGRMMARNPMNCEWITASCGQGQGQGIGSSTKPLPTIAPKPPMMIRGSATMTPAMPPVKGQMRAPSTGAVAPTGL
jgi:peptidoglycan hydrolase-like protein with peptidoglycan-binding domain